MSIDLKPEVSALFQAYLGDSVYADYDGYHIILQTHNGLPDDPSNRIALDPSAVAALNKYVESLTGRVTAYNAAKKPDAT